VKHSKEIIQATVAMSEKAIYKAEKLNDEKISEIEAINKNGLPYFPVGQIIFDINGEYANQNLQDQGTAISELFSKIVTRYSVLQKKDFKVLKVNFYNDVVSGFELIKSQLEADTADYVKSFLSVDLSEPEDKKDFSLRLVMDALGCIFVFFMEAVRLPENFKSNLMEKPH
jgi:hypothetical protein